MSVTSELHKITNEDHLGKPFVELSYFLSNRIRQITGVVEITPELILGLMQEHKEYAEQSQKLELVYRPLHAGEHHTGIF